MDANIIELSCLKHTPNDGYKLQIKIKGEVVLLAEGATAQHIFANIKDLWKQQPEFEYDLEVKPYDCDHIKEGNIITLRREIR